MYRKCTTEISVQHQRQVEESLLKLMGKMPYEDITVTQLCAAAGVSRRVFYHLFNNKTGALYALVDHWILNMESYRTDIADETLRFFLYWKEQKTLLDALQDNGLNGLLMERITESVIREDYDIRYWLKVDGEEMGRDILIFSLCGAMGMAYSWYYEGFQKSPEEMAQRMVRLIKRPLVGGSTE